MSRIFLQEAIDLIGGQLATAKKIGVSQSLVWKWLNTTRHGVPGEYVIPICAAIDFQVTPHQLRADLYPHASDGLPENLKQVA